MFPVNYRPPEQLPSHHRDFPQRENPSGILPNTLHARMARLLFLIVFCCLLASLNGILLLNALGSRTHTTAANEVRER